MLLVITLYRQLDLFGETFEDSIKKVEKNRRGSASMDERKNPLLFRSETNFKGFSVAS